MMKSKNEITHITKIIDEQNRLIKDYETNLNNKIKDIVDRDKTKRDMKNEMNKFEKKIIEKDTIIKET